MQGPWIVVMGVSGSGKSSVGAALASALGLPFVEGDDFHSARNVQRMRDGHALSDADRSDWLAALAEQLRLHPRGAVMSCSALRQCYRQTLREAVPALSFLFLDLPQSEAERRVIAREHFFSPALVQSQFETLESPDEESGVLRVSAIQPIEAIVHAQLQALGR